LVIPVYVPGDEANHYYTINSSNKIVLPPAGVPLDLKNRVVFVPKGTSYTVYLKGAQNKNLLGYILLPVGNADYLEFGYPNDDINYQKLSSSTFYVYDEDGNENVPRS
jgi:hypothetical protein